MIARAQLRPWIAPVATSAMVAMSGVAALCAGRPSTVVLLVLAAFLPYSALVVSELSLDRRSATRLAVVLALGAGAILVIAPPVLSDDVFRYLWDGRVLGHGISPYRYAPDDPAVAHLRDAWWARINNPDIATVYPPVAQAIFAGADAVWHHPASLKAAALLAHLATIPVVARIAGDGAPRAALLHGLNPLCLVESALSGHIDAVAGLALVSAVASLLSNRAGLAALLVGAASGVKLIGLAVAPLIALRDRRAVVLAVVLAVLPVIPLLGAGGSNGSAGITHYTRRWQGNEGGFAVLEGLASAGLSVAARGGSVELPWLGQLVSGLEGSALDPRATLAAEKKDAPEPTRFPVAFLASLLARGLALAIVLGLAVVLVRRRVEPLVAARWVVLSALLLAPQVHPWYLLWLLPIEVAARGKAGLVWSAAVLVAYAPLDGWVAARVWVEHPAARAIEYALVVGVLTAESLRIGKNTCAAPVHVG